MRIKLSNIYKNHSHNSYNKKEEIRGSFIKETFGVFYMAKKKSSKKGLKFNLQSLVFLN